MFTWVLAITFLLPATIAALYYFVLMNLARFTRPVKARLKPTTRFAILVPAHNEELSLPATLESLANIEYPGCLTKVIVIADNCSDQTAEVARRFDVTVLERNEPALRGKGFGLEYAMKTVLRSKPDAVLMLDADGELQPDALRIFDACFARGDLVVQGSIRTRDIGYGASAIVAAVGNVMDDAIAAGRDQLGWRVRLRGSNMAFRREVLETVPWTCHGLTEDAEYGSTLHAAGVPIRFEAAAKARSESPGNLTDLSQQRRRWRAALGWHWLESKPLVLSHLMLTSLFVATVVRLVPETTAVTLVWLALLWLVTAAVYLQALRQLEQRFSLTILFVIPRVVLRLVAVTLGGLFRREADWQRTRRAAENL